MTNRYSTLGMVCCLALSGAPGAHASDALASLMPLSLEELIATPVITASRRAEGREQTPTHIMVFTREQLRDRRYKSLADLLEDLPGVDFQRATRSSQYNNFVFQGHVSNNKILILLDGVRIDHPAGGKIPVAENFSLHFAKQVEVLFGPAAALYGADAFAGVINIITDKPGDALAGKIAVGLGNFGALEGNFQVGGALGAGFTLTASAHDQASDRAPLDKSYPASYPKVAAGGVPAAQREDYVGNMSSQSQYFRLDYKDDLTIGFYRNRFRSLSSTGDNAASAFYLSNVFWDSTIATWYGKYRFALAPSIKAELVLDYSSYEIDPQSRYINKVTNFQDHGYDYAYARRRGIEQNLNWQVNAQHVVLAGIGFKDYAAIETPDLPHAYNTQQGADGQGMTYANTRIPLQIFDASYRSWSGYLQWQAQWTPALATMIGLRDDWYSTYGNSLNPRLGLTWKAAEGNYLKLLYGEAFRTPSPEESYSAFGSFDRSGKPSGLFRAPNEALEPEKSRTLSLTWDWRPHRQFNLITNAYRTHVEGVITTRTDATPIQYIPDTTLTQTESKQNSGQDAYYGVDLIPQWQTHLGGPWNADFWGSYSMVNGYFRETLDGPKRDLINIASHKLKLGVTLRYQDWLTITPRLQWIDQTSTGAVNRSQNDRLKMTDSYTVANLHIAMHKLAGERLSVYVDIYNLFDERYYAAHTSSSSSVLQAVPQQPRTYMGTLEYRF